MCLFEDILHTVVKWQLASRRQGTHAAKTRGEVSGGGKSHLSKKELVTLVKDLVDLH